MDAGALEDRGEAVIVQQPGNVRNAKFRELVGCGSPVRNGGIEWRIVDPETYVALPDLKVGEVWVSGPSKPESYFDQSDEKNRDTFHSNLSADRPDGDGDLTKSYLRTGDLAFLYRGTVYVCGRIKDVIIVRGRNYYPQDIESVFEADPRIRDGCLAAVAVEPADEPLREGGTRLGRAGPLAHSAAASAGAGAANSSSETERILLVSELRDPLKLSVAEMHAMAGKLALDVRAYTGLSLWSVMFIETRSVPKTTSGKIARSWVKRGWDADTLKKVFIWKEGCAEPTFLHPLLRKKQAKAAARAAAAASSAGDAGSAGGACSGGGSAAGGVVVVAGAVDVRLGAMEERLIAMDARQQMELICWQRYHFECLVLFCIVAGVALVRPWDRTQCSDPRALYVCAALVGVQLLRVLARLRPWAEDANGGGVGFPAQLSAKGHGTIS